MTWYLFKLICLFSTILAVTTVLVLEIPPAIAEEFPYPLTVGRIEAKLAFPIESSYQWPADNLPGFLHPSPIRDIHPGEQFLLTTNVTNTSDKPVSFYMIFEVRHYLGITHDIKWQTGTIAPHESQVVASPWSSRYHGSYEVRTFALSELENPLPLSDLASSRYFRLNYENWNPEPTLQLRLQDQNGIWQSYSGIEGYYFIIPKSVITVNKGQQVLLGLSNTMNWTINKVTVDYPLLRIGEDVTVSDDQGEYYNSAESLVENRDYVYGYLDPFVTKDLEYVYVMDVPDGEYLLQVNASYFYKINNTNVDISSGSFYFRISVKS